MGNHKWIYIFFKTSKIRRRQYITYELLCRMSGLKWQVQYSELMSWNKAGTFHDFYSHSNEFFARFATWILFLFRKMADECDEFISAICLSGLFMSKKIYIFFYYTSVIGQWKWNMEIPFFFVKRNKSTLGWSCILGEKQKFIEKNHCYLHLNIVRYSRRSFLECQFCQLLFTRGNLTFANSMESFLATLDRKCYSITFRSVSINFRLIIQCICLHG